jgi:hypothetical protein
MRGHVGAGAVWSSASCHPERSEGYVSNRVGAGVVWMSRPGWFNSAPVFDETLGDLFRETKEHT